MCWLWVCVLCWYLRDVSDVNPVAPELLPIIGSDDIWPGFITLHGDCGWDPLSCLVILNAGLLSGLEWLQIFRMPVIVYLLLVLSLLQLFTGPVVQL